MGDTGSNTAQTPRGKLWRWAKRLFVIVIVAPVMIVSAILVLLARREVPVTFDTTAAKGISFIPMKQVVPGPGLPADLPLMQANNNLDVISFGGEYFLVFRTAPFHFASPKTRLYVLRSSDRQHWQRDGEIFLGSDMREPRLLAFNGKLFLYFFQAGTEMLKFEPKHIFASERLAEGQWSKPRAVYEPGYVVWRVKAHGDKAYMSVYYGSNIYASGKNAGEVRLLVSPDGYMWTPISEQPQMTDVGAEEAEFEFDEEGNLVIVVRQEVRGGSTVCMAPKENLGEWRKQFSPYKYDSSYMFRRGKDFYVIARRNVSGTCDLGLDMLPKSLRIKLNFAHYSLTRKRTALYRVDLENMCLVPLFDFPSKGDTAFAGLAPIDAHSYYMVNYSSPIEGWDWPWLFGQLQPTHVYESVLTFP